MAIPEIFRKRAERPPRDLDIYDQTIGRRRAFARISNPRPTSQSRLSR